MWEQRGDKTRVPNAKKLVYISGSYLVADTLFSTTLEPRKDALWLWWGLEDRKWLLWQEPPHTRSFLFGTTDPHPHSSHHESADLFPPGIIQGEVQAGDPVEETPPHPPPGRAPSLLCIFVLSGRCPWLRFLTFVAVFHRYVYSARILFKQSYFFIPEGHSSS